MMRTLTARASRALLAIAAVAFVTLSVSGTAFGADDRVPATRIAGYITAKDGTQIHYLAQVPKPDGQRKRFPTIMSYSGYSPSWGYAPGSEDITTGLSYIQRGYAFIGVSMRGTGCSEGGPFVTFDPKWGSDGAAAVEWVARQSWSNGRVGMTGGSFPGLSQLFTAIHRPRGLAAIAPREVVVDPLRDTAKPGGVPNVLFPTGWWAANIAPTWINSRIQAAEIGNQRCIDTIDRNLAQAVTPATSAAEHPFYDAFHRSHTLLGKTHRINVPVLSMESFQDGDTGVRAGYYQETIKPKKLWYLGMTGPHLHDRPEALDEIEFRFFDHFLKGLKNGFVRETARTTIWQEVTAPRDEKSATGFDDNGARPSRVIKFNHYPPRVKPVVLHLRSKGQLTWRRPARGSSPDRYKYPVPGPAVNDLLFNDGDWSAQDADWREGSVAYTSRRLKRALALFGSARANLWVSTTAPDTDLQVTVTEVRPNGQEQYVQRGWLRLSDRALWRKRSTPLRPVHKLSRAASSMPEKGKPVLAPVEIEKFSHTFRRGSRLRIWIDTPNTTGRFGFEALSDPGANRVWHGPRRPSRVVFGRLPVKGPQKARPSCRLVRHMPCRPDPLAG